MAPSRSRSSKNTHKESIKNKNKNKSTKDNTRRLPKKNALPSSPKSILEDEDTYSDTIEDDDVFDEPMEQQIEENAQTDVSLSLPQPSFSLQQSPSSTVEYEVEELLEKKVYYSDVQYKVKWVGYPSSANTWETIENLTGAVEKLYEFEEDTTKKRAKGNCDGKQTPKTTKIIAQERMELIRSTTPMKKVLAIYPKTENEAEQTAVEFINGLILMIKEEELKFMSAPNRTKIEEEINWQKQLVAVKQKFEGDGKQKSSSKCPVQLKKNDALDNG